MGGAINERGESLPHRGAGLTVGGCGRRPVCVGRAPLRRAGAAEPGRRRTMAWCSSSEPGNTDRAAEHSRLGYRDSPLSHARVDAGKSGRLVSA